MNILPSTTKKETNILPEMSSAATLIKMALDTKILHPMAEMNKFRALAFSPAFLSAIAFTNPTHGSVESKLIHFTKNKATNKAPQKFPKYVKTIFLMPFKICNKVVFLDNTLVGTEKTLPDSKSEPVSNTNINPTEKLMLCYPCTCINHTLSQKWAFEAQD